MSKLKLIFLAIPLSFIFNVNINAQSTGMLEEVVVTAQKREESLQDAPIAITAITESTIDDSASFFSVLSSQRCKKITFLQ